MIIVKLKGGLGNQLFQYALGKQLSLIHNSVLLLDKSYFATYKMHRYGLKPFIPMPNFATPSDIAGVLSRGTVLARLFLHGHKSYIQETDFTKCDPKILTLPDDIYLDGFWQSERYFVDISNTIRQEFSCKLPMGRLDKILADQISQSHSISVHIRHGDYLSDPTAAQHGICSPDYYQRAFTYLSRRLSTGHIFVFSDDHQWVKKNIHFPWRTTYVTHNNAATNYQDLRLMSLCKHHVIANSTFSWWGAWMSANPNKTVLTPSRWYQDKKLSADDIIPKNWIKL